jgi:hypothetical protein
MGGSQRTIVHSTLQVRTPETLPLHFNLRHTSPVTTAPIRRPGNHCTICSQSYPIPHFPCSATLHRCPTLTQLGTFVGLARFNCRHQYKYFIRKDTPNTFSTLEVTRNNTMRWSSALDSSTYRWNFALSYTITYPLPPVISRLKTLSSSNEILTQPRHP